MWLSRLTERGFAGSNSAARFLLSQRVEGPAAEASPYCCQGAGGIVETGAEEGADGLDDPVRDLRARGGASYFLKLDISEEKQRKIRSKERSQKNTKIAGRGIHTYLKWSINELYCNFGR